MRHDHLCAFKIDLKYLLIRKRTVLGYVLAIYIDERGCGEGTFSLRLSEILKKFEFFFFNVALSVSDDGMGREMDASDKPQINAGHLTQW